MQKLDKKGFDKSEIISVKRSQRWSEWPTESPSLSHRSTEQPLLVLTAFSYWHLLAASDILMATLYWCKIHISKMNNYFVRKTFIQPTLLPLKTYSTLAKPYKGYERSEWPRNMQRSTINYEDSHKNVRNLHVYNKKTKKQKQYFCTLWTCNFSMFLLPFFSLADMKWPVLQLHRRREHTAWWQIFNYFLLGVDHLIFYVARYFFDCSSPAGFF